MFITKGDTDQFLRSSDGEGSAMRSSAKNREEQALNYSWAQLCSANESERRAAAKQIVKMLHTATTEERTSLKTNLPRIVRLAFECPFPDVSKAFADLLIALRPVRITPFY